MRQSALERELERYLGVFDRFGDPFSLLLFGVERDPDAAPVGPGTFAGSTSPSEIETVEALDTASRAADQVLDAGPGLVAVVLPKCARAAAEEAAERLTAALAEARPGRPPQWWGLATCPVDGTSAEMLGRVARAGLIRASGYQADPAWRWQPQPAMPHFDARRMTA